jgi:hypothetical protein
MANRNVAGMGFTPVSTLGNAPATSGQSKYKIDNGNATNIFLGTQVQTAAGYVTVGAVNSKTIGVFNGCFYTAANTQKPTFSNMYIASTATDLNQDIDAFVNDNPFQNYAVSANDATPQAAFMETYQSSAVAGSTVTGRSSQTLDIGNTSATASQWRLLRSAEDPENEDLTVAFGTVVVVQNLCEFVTPS